MKWAMMAVLPLLTGGCVARAAWDVATLPVKAGARGIDLLTVSERERDEKWVRQQRKADEARLREEQRRAKAPRDD